MLSNTPPVISVSSGKLKNVSLSPNDTDILYSTFEIQTNIFVKAESLLERESWITSFPGMQNAYLVESKSNPKEPHKLKVYSNGNVECVNNCLQYKSYKICLHSVAIAEKYACLKTFVALVKKDPASLNSLVNSRQLVNTGKKTISSTQKRKRHKTSSKEVPISFSQKPKEATKPSNKEINSSSLDDESAESESEYPQVREVVKNANDLAGNSNAGRPSNWKSPSKSYYANSQPGQFLVSLLKMVPPKTTSCFRCRKNIRTFQVQSQMSLHEESRGLVVVGKAHRPMLKDSSGALQYTPDLRNVYFHVNERCIRCIFPYFNGRMLQICNQYKEFLSQF